MIRFLSDENFNGHIVRAFRTTYPRHDLLTITEAGLAGWQDPAVLDWAGQERRVILSHDEETMIGFAHARVTAGLPMAGLVEVRRHLRIQDVLYDLGIIDQCSTQEEWEGQFLYLPI